MANVPYQTNFRFLLHPCLVAALPLINNYSFLIQNVNSLNLNSCASSRKGRRVFHKKMTSIFRQMSDFILLCDTRLTDRRTKEFYTFCRSNPTCKYEAFFTHTGSKRGVAVLKKNDVDLECEIIASDPLGNFIILKCFHKSNPNDFFYVSSVYGPYQCNDNLFVSKVLDHFVDSNVDFLVGGDWNSVTDSRSPPDNLDLLNPLVPMAPLVDRFERNFKGHLIRGF